MNQGINHINYNYMLLSGSTQNYSYDISQNMLQHFIISLSKEYSRKSNPYDLTNAPVHPLKLLPPPSLTLTYLEKHPYNGNRYHPIVLGTMVVMFGDEISPIVRHYYMSPHFLRVCELDLKSYKKRNWSGDCLTRHPSRPNSLPLSS